MSSKTSLLASMPEKFHLEPGFNFIFDLVSSHHNLFQQLVVSSEKMFAEHIS